MNNLFRMMYEVFLMVDIMSCFQRLFKLLTRYMDILMIKTVVFIFVFIVFSHLLTIIFQILIVIGYKNQTYYNITTFIAFISRLHYPIVKHTNFLIFLSICMLFQVVNHHSLETIYQKLLYFTLLRINECSFIYLKLLHFNVCT